MGAQSSKDSLSSCSETLPDRSLKHNKSPSHRRLSSSSSENNNIKNSSRSPSLHNRSVGASGRNVFTQHDEALLLSRPLPLTPSYTHDSDSDSAITGSSLSVDVIRGKHFNTAMRHSLHPILPPSMLDSAVEFAESGPSPFPLFMVVYDFIACGEGQLSIKKGEMLHFISYNQSQEWCEVQALTRGEIGWVPASYITPVLNHQLNAHNPPMNNSKENDTPLPSDLSKCTWYHGPTSRQEAEAILSCGVNGSFLVRESETAPGKWSISLRFDGKVYHYRINETCDGLHKLYIQPEAQFQTLNSLIQYHCEYSGGLVSTLLFPAPRNSQSKEHGLSSSTSLSSFLHGKNEGASSFRPDGDVWEVDKSELNMKSKIGAGQYGEVYEAVWKRHNIRVAVKTLKQDYMEVDEFMQEAHIMKKLCHPNLVRLYGVCTRELPVLTVLEFMGNGNLLDYLRHEKRKIHVKDLLYMAKQVASAMNYLESLNYIHRDLAARNVLLSVNGNDHTVKIADFGLARKVSDKNEDGGYYVAHAGAKFPIKWTAPEGLAYNKFSSQSDVWAFGVLLWEMATFGESPYPGMDITEVYQKLETGYRMPAPQGCPKTIYALMRRTWEWDAQRRPSFREIEKFFIRLLRPSNAQALEIDYNLNHDSQYHHNHHHQRSDSNKLIGTPPSTFVSKIAVHHSRNDSLHRHGSTCQAASPQTFLSQNRRNHHHAFHSSTVSLASMNARRSSVHVSCDPGADNSWSSPPLPPRNKCLNQLDSHEHEMLQFPDPPQLSPSENTPSPIMRQHSGRGSGRNRFSSQMPFAKPLPPVPHKHAQVLSNNTKALEFHSAMRGAAHLATLPKGAKISNYLESLRAQHFNSSRHFGETDGGENGEKLNLVKTRRASKSKRNLSLNGEPSLQSMIDIPPPPACATFDSEHASSSGSEGRNSVCSDAERCVSPADKWTNAVDKENERKDNRAFRREKSLPVQNNANHADKQMPNSIAIAAAAAAARAMKKPRPPPPPKLHNEKKNEQRLSDAGEVSDEKVNFFAKLRSTKGGKLDKGEWFDECRNGKSSDNGISNGEKNIFSIPLRKSNQHRFSLRGATGNARESDGKVKKNDLTSAAQRNNVKLKKIQDAEEGENTSAFFIKRRSSFNSNGNNNSIKIQPIRCSSPESVSSSSNSSSNTSESLESPTLKEKCFLSSTRMSLKHDTLTSPKYHQPEKSLLVTIDSETNGNHISDNNSNLNKDPDNDIKGENPLFNHPLFMKKRKDDVPLKNGDSDKTEVAKSCANISNPPNKGTFHKVFSNKFSRRETKT